MTPSSTGNMVYKALVVLTCLVVLGFAGNHFYIDYVRKQCQKLSDSIDYRETIGIPQRPARHWKSMYAELDEDRSELMKCYGKLK